MQKPSIPKGTRDFSPEEMAKRNYIFDTIKEVYHLYGFQQIETPAMENLSTLMGKYGEEGDKLLFKILDSGDYLYHFKQEDLDRLFRINNEIRSKILRKINSKKSKTRILQDISTSHYYEDIGAEVIKRLEINKFIVKTDSGFTTNLTVLQLEEKIELIIVEIIRGEIGQKIGKEKGLRYDLTVPFARFVVMHRDKISFPFKRYQIQPVWRADRPQKGRYREFYQCDADVVGSDSLLNEVELVQIMDEVYRRFAINVCIKINNRKILSGIAEVIGETDKITDITVAIDKFDKIGLENVNNELAAKGISAEAIQKLQPIILLKGSNNEKLEALKKILATSETGLKGVEELEYIFNYIRLLNIATPVELDLTLARGLNYYTGAIFEVKALDVEIGSITGGGRYDNLTGVFGMPGVSGVGISFGADRIYDVLNQLDLYPKDTVCSTEVIFINFGEKETAYCFPILNELRKNGVKAEIYPDAAKLKKQMTYANNKSIPFVVIVGENEMNENKVTLKNMLTGDQQLIPKNDLLKALK